ncbi:MAG TPA: threonine ammonia-lyase [Stellaceae bacterium]|nr:threonine ammonia-lyase [Stellaceae bacterium]
MDPSQNLSADIPPSVADIHTAAGVIAGSVIRTPCLQAAALSAQLGMDVALKLETQQRTGSFKERGALNRLSHLDAQERARGVIAMSAGNHAQGVAYHAQRLGIPATIVMPQDTPFTKVERTAAYGARVLLRGTGLAEAREAVAEIVAEQGLVLVHPYDDAHVIAGQGTIGLEILADQPEIDTLIVPIGGGGLIAGIAIAAKALKPDIEIIGVQSRQFPSMYNVIKDLPLPDLPGQTLAEGIAVKEPGWLTRRVVREHVADIVLVSEEQIERAVELLSGSQKLVAEGAGAAGVAALIAEPARFLGRKLATVICGGNIDSRILASVLMRGLVRAGRMVRLRAEISDSPGTLARVARIIGEAGGNIVEIFHQRLFHDVPVKLADLDVVIETRDGEHVREIIQRMQEAGYKTVLLSN